MPFDYDRLIDWQFDTTTQEYDVWDTIRYALSIGIGRDPTDARQLRFTYEDGLRAFPTMALVLASPGFWPQDPETGIDWKNVLHVGERLEMHRPLPEAGRLSARIQVSDIVDRGEGRGALIRTVRDLFDAYSGDRLATETTDFLCRGDGGCGGPAAPCPGLTRCRTARRTRSWRSKPCRSRRCSTA